MTEVSIALNAVDVGRYADAAALFSQAEIFLERTKDSRRKRCARLARLRCLLMAGNLQELKLLLLRTMIDRDYSGELLPLTTIQLLLALEELDLQASRDALAELDRIVRGNRELGRAALLACESELRAAEGEFDVAISALERAWVQVPGPGAFCPVELATRMCFLYVDKGDLFSAEKWAEMVSPNKAARLCCQLQSFLARLEVAVHGQLRPEDSVIAKRLDALLQSIQCPHYLIRGVKLVSLIKLMGNDCEQVTNKWWRDKWVLLKRARVSRRTALAAWLAIADIRQAAARQSNTAAKFIQRGTWAMERAKRTRNYAAAGIATSEVCLSSGQLDAGMVRL